MQTEARCLGFSHEKPAPSAYSRWEHVFEAVAPHGQRCLKTKGIWSGSFGAADDRHSQASALPPRRRSTSRPWQDVVPCARPGKPSRMRPRSTRDDGRVADGLATFPGNSLICRLPTVRVPRSSLQRSCWTHIRPLQPRNATTACAGVRNDGIRAQARGTPPAMARSKECPCARNGPLSPRA